MPTELRCSIHGADKGLVGFCLESPKEVLRILHREFFVGKYEGLVYPFGPYNNEQELGLVITGGKSPIGTRIEAYLTALNSYLQQFKLQNPLSTEQIFNGLKHTFDHYSQHLIPYLDLNKHQREKLKEEKKSRIIQPEILIANFLEIIGVTLNEEPTEDNLRFLFIEESIKK